uniref:Ankyrin repeat domain-containing protein 6 n=1 Tax=Heterorhabditis bacteriophora TaxID=37862 RepID=A0A1I7X0W7_HETBA
MDGGGDEVTLCSLISLLKTEHPEKLASKPALSFPHPTVQDIESLESYPDLGVETISGLEKHNTGDSAFRPQHSTISSSENTVNNRRTPVAGFGKHSVLPPKSCLTRVVLQTPAKPNQKKKTVAFGKTVNVSQTVEGTSRLAKQKAEMNKYSKTSPAEVTNKENNDPTTIREDQQKVCNVLCCLSSVIDTTMEMKESIQVLTRQIQENEKNIEILKKEKEEMYVCMLLDHYTTVFMFKHQFDVDTDLDSLTLAELRRLMDKNPVFRQYVADIRAEEEEERKNYRIKQNKLDWDKNDGRQGEKCMQRTVEREAWQKDEDKRANKYDLSIISKSMFSSNLLIVADEVQLLRKNLLWNAVFTVLHHLECHHILLILITFFPIGAFLKNRMLMPMMMYNQYISRARVSAITHRDIKVHETAAEERRRLRRERRAKQKF